MAYGLVLKNADGVTVIDISSRVLNSETISVTSVTVDANSSTDVTVPDAHIPEAVVFDLVGGDVDITTTTSTDTVTVTNTTSISRTMTLETWRML